MPIKPRCCNPFSCFSAVEKRPDTALADAQTAPSESGPGASQDVADVPGVPGCYKAQPSRSSNVSLTYEGEEVDARLNVSGPPRCDEASTSGSSNVPNTRSEEEDADVNLNVSGAPRCINEASTSGSSNVPNRSEEQDVDLSLNVSEDPQCINAAPSCSSSSGATKSRSNLISSIRKDIVEVEDVNLDDLMNHIYELLKLREEGKQQQASNLRKFPWPKVPGLQKLKKIVSFAPDLQKLQNTLSAAVTFGTELKDIIHGPVTALLKDMGKVSVASAGLLVVAHALERLDDAFTNNKKCWDLIKEMSYVASIVKRLKESPKGMAQFVIPEATSLLIEGAIMCCKQIDGSAWKTFFLSSKIKGDLSDIRQKLHAMYLHINTEIGFRVLSAVEREGRSPLSKGYPTHAIGIDEPIKEVLRLLEIESDQNTVTVILHGFGGTGKTTLGDAVFSEVGGCKYSKVRLFNDINSTPVIIELQKQILKDLMEPGETIPEIRTHEDGQRELESVLANVHAFIYIDNVLEARALRMLLPHDITQAKKVRFLLTARDHGVKISCPRSGTIPKIYEMKGIQPQSALMILKREIKEGINDTQFDQITQICGKIPLMLALVASFIGRSDNKEEAYSTVMRQKEKWTSDEFQEMRYAFAYDALPSQCKDPFLDICTYFNGWDWDIVQDIVGKDELRMLESRALVTKDTYGDASVHDIILTLARQKSEEESHGEEVRKTFTSARELEKFLENEDIQGIKGIWLDRDYGAALHICASRLDSMHNSLRVLHLETPTKVEGNCNKKFKELIYLKANIIQLPFRVSQLRYLSCEFPQNMPPMLRLVNFDGSSQSRTVQVLSTELRNLRVLIFINFTKLKELPKELGKLVSLRVLKLIACESIQKLPEGFGQLKNLEELDLGKCRDLRELCNDFPKLASLIVLNLEGCESIRKLPEGLDQLKNLKMLVLRRCRNLTELRNDFSSLSLQTLDLRECDRLEQFPGDGSCPSTDISVQALSISESQKENIENNVLSEFDRMLTDGRGEPFHLSHLPPNTPVLVICDTHLLLSSWLLRLPWHLIEETIDETQTKFEIIYIGNNFDKLPKRIKDRIFVIRLPCSRVQEVLRQVCLTIDAAVPSGIDFGYLRMHTKTVGENSDNYSPCWRFLTEGELEEFVVCNSGRYLRLKQLQAERDEESSIIEMLRELFAPDGDETTPVFQKNESSQKVRREFLVSNCKRYLRLKQLEGERDEESSNIEMLRELFAPDGDETTPVFGKKDSSGQVTTCGVDQLKGKTILLDLRSDQLFDDIGLRSLKEMYEVVVKQKLDLEIISIPICSRTRSGYLEYDPFLVEVPWFVFQSGTRAIRKVAQFFLTKQCGWEEGDECEKWYASINCIIEPNGRVIPCRPFTKYTEGKSTPILKFLFNHLEGVSDQVKRIMFQVKWGVKACPTVHEEIENFKSEEWEQLKSMSTLEFLFNHLESTSNQVKKLMCQGKIICLRSGYEYDGCAQLMNEMDQFKKGIHIISVGDIRMERLLLTDTIYKNCYKLYTIPTDVEKMSSLNLSSHERMRFSSRLHYLKEAINRIKERDKKLSELKSVLQSFHDQRSMTFMDQYGKLVATLGANNIQLIFPQGKKHRAERFIKSMMKDIEGGKEMHDKDPGVSDSLIQNMQTASTSVAVEQQNMDTHFESLREYISELWEVERYQLFKFNKEGKKSSPSRVTWPPSTGFRMLENFLSEGTHANWVKDVISRRPEEVIWGTVIKRLLNDIEEENWGVAGLLAVAHVLERFDSVSAEPYLWLLVLDEMLRVAQYIKQLNQKPELSWRRIKHVATVSIVICSIACSALIDPSKFALFELPTVDNGQLEGFQCELELIGNNIAEAITEGLDDESGSESENMCDTFEFFFETSWY